MVVAMANKFEERQAERSRREGPSEKDRSANEADRKRKRDEIKRELAKQKLAGERLKSVRSAIAEVEERKESIADAHSIATAPIQAKLQEIERRQVDAILNGSARDEFAEEQRKRLLEDLRNQNVKLEEAIAAEDRLLNSLRREEFEVGRETVGNKSETDLLRSASERLRHRVRVTDWHHERADRYLKHLQNPENRPRYEPSLYAVALEFAQAELERARELAAVAYREAIEE